MKHAANISVILLGVALFLLTCKREEPLRLHNTAWTSDFYGYHNVYRFETDSSGVLEQSMMRWMLGDLGPDSTVAPDSLLPMGENNFVYAYINDSTLRIHVFQEEVHESYDMEFHQRFDEAGEPYFAATEAFAYGTEVLVPVKK